MSNNAFLRQAILDKQLKTLGYEFLYDAIPQQKEESIEELLAKISNHTQAYIDCTSRIEADNYDFLEIITEQNVIFVIRTDKLPQDSLVRIVQRIKEKGFKVAIASNNLTATDAPLIELIDIVKLDMLQLTEQEFQRAIQLIKKYKKLVYAEKVESHMALELCKKLAIDGFQGEFLTSPNLGNNTKNKNNGLVLMQLLNKLQDPGVALEEVEIALSHDPRLAFKLLRVVNSPAYGLRRKIESLRDAVIYIGLHQVRRWVSMLAMGNVEGKPLELMTTAMIRARMCELLAEKYNYEDRSGYFTAGLFSTLDALFDEDMSKLLADIYLADHIKQALIAHQGCMGELLAKVINYEKADWSIFSENKQYQEFSEAYINSLAWADECSNQLYGMQ
ncbi:MAG: HDOD domain-containing protein [Gammaproteobacteria bacterium]